MIHEDAWAPAESAPEAIVGLVSMAARGWEVSPAIMLGRPHSLWLELDINLTTTKHQGE